MATSQMTGSSDVRPQERRFENREQGLALFVVLVLIVVLGVIVSQLVFSTKIEESVARARTGQLELALSLEAAAQAALVKVYEDWEEDKSKEADFLSGMGQNPGQNPGQGPGQNPAPGDPADPGAGQGDQGDSPFDSRHEAWAHPFKESINECDVDVRIVDGESRVDVNYLFEYVVPILEPDAEPEEGDPFDPENPEDPVDPEEEDDELLEEEPDFNTFQQDWEAPDEEVERWTQVFLARMIEAMVAYNQEYEFDYDDTPSPETSAETIIDWVLDRKQRVETRHIRSLDGLAELDAIGWELFHGPLDPRAEEEEDEDGDGEDDRPSDNRLAELEEVLGGFSTDLFQSMEDEDVGVEEIPKPLGLKHVLTATSSGKLNLNTMRPEILTGLLVSIEDFTTASEIALDINEHLNSKVEESEDDQEPEPLPEDDEDEEEQPQEFNTFTSLGQMTPLMEKFAWEEIEIEDPNGDEKTVLEVLNRDLEKVVFRSEYFTASLEGERVKRALKGDIVFRRGLPRKTEEELDDDEDPDAADPADPADPTDPAASSEDVWVIEVIMFRLRKD